MTFNPPLKIRQPAVAGAFYPGQGPILSQEVVALLDEAQPADNLSSTLTHKQTCGGTPVNGLLLVARRHQLQPQLLGRCNSGDTAGDKGRVVGYASVAFMEGHHHVQTP